MADVLEGRRQWLKGLALTFLTMLMPKFVTASKTEVDPEQAQRFLLIGLFRHPASARMVGCEYLRLYPEEADPALLVRLLMLQVEIKRDTIALKRALQEKRRRDFGRGDVVMLKGCLMSRTELRLCALAAIP